MPGSAQRTIEGTDRAVAAIAAVGAFPLTLGGDHSITLGELRALRRCHGPLGLVQFDSHSDLSDALWGDRYSHATFHRRAIEEGLVDPQRSVIVGLRGSLDSEEDARLPQDLGLHVLSSYSFLMGGAGSAAQMIRKIVGEGPCFVSFDVDMVDPAYAPGTGTPEVGGPPSWQVIETLRRLAGLLLVGVDVAEMVPPYDSGGITALLRATVAYELLALHVVGPERLPSSKAPDAAAR